MYRAVSVPYIWLHVVCEALQIICCLRTYVTTWVSRLHDCVRTINGTTYSPLFYAEIDTLLWWNVSYFYSFATSSACPVLVKEANIINISYSHIIYLYLTFNFSILSHKWNEYITDHSQPSKKVVCNTCSYYSFHRLLYVHWEKNTW